MNKLIRIILYITAGCIGIGCAALILSFALGAHLSEGEDSMFQWAKDTALDAAMNAKKQVKQAQDQMIADEKREYSTYEGDSHELAVAEGVYEESYDEDYEGGIGLLAVDASGIEELAIHLQHGYLSIQESNDNRILVSISESAEGITANCESGKVTIQDDRAGRHGRKEVYIYLQIPAGLQLQNADIRINAGAVEADCGFGAHNLTVNAGAGLISLEEVRANVFNASVGAGEIDIEDSVLHTVKLDCGVGVMNMEADITGDAEIKCGMGEIDIEMEKDVEDVNYLLHCGAGSIEIGDHTYSGLAKEKQIHHGASATFKVDCGMGYISID